MYRQGFQKFRCWLHASALCACMLVHQGCVDEDLSDCDSMCDITYHLQLEMDLQLTIKNALAEGAEAVLAEAILNDLQDVVTDRASHVSLSFYDSEAGQALQHDSLQANTNRLTRKLYLPAGNYEHIAVANTAEEPAFTGHETDRMRSYRITHGTADTVSSHASAIYVGNMSMEILHVMSHNFYLPLHMQNAVAVLVIDTHDSPAEIVDVYTNEMACGINCLSREPIFDNNYVIRNSRTEAEGLVAYHAVCFPSGSGTGTRQEAADDPAAGSIWHMDVITRTPDRQYVRNIIYVKEPLLAGEAKVLKVHLTENGEIASTSSNIGISIVLNWEPGGNYDVII